LSVFITVAGFIVVSEIYPSKQVAIKQLPDVIAPKSKSILPVDYESQATWGCKSPRRTLGGQRFLRRWQRIVAVAAPAASASLSASPSSAVASIVAASQLL
jgi:hypothetical protein